MDHIVYIMPRKYTKSASRIVIDETTGLPAPARGAGARGGRKKRSAVDIGRTTDIYGSRTVVAANPFDDDHHQASPASNLGPSTPLTSTINSPAPPPPIHSPYGQMPNITSHHMLDAHPSPMQHTSPPAAPTMHQSTIPHYMQHLPNSYQDYNLVSSPPLPPNIALDIEHNQPPPMINHHHQQPPPPLHMSSGPYSSILSCGRCRQEIYPNQARIKCEASCQMSYHRGCSGMTEMACDLLQRETYAEWVCDSCISSGISTGERIPLVRYKYQDYRPQPVYVQQ